MINIVGGNFMTPDGVPIADGSINFELNINASIIAAPYGLIPGKADSPVNFQLDANGDILPNAPESEFAASND
jgi:hypothetical protein